MPIWIEALLGLAAIALVAWEDKVRRRWKNGKRDQDR